MKNKLIVIFSWLLVLASMLMIYNFSAENAEMSTATSEGVIVQILGIFMEKEEITHPVIIKYQFPIRKAAHFGIYMLLGFCMLSAFEKTFKIKIWLNIVFSLISCVLYAISDEIHQNFSAGRGPSPKDVLIDSAGALCGILIFWALLALLHKIEKHLKRSR